MLNLRRKQNKQYLQLFRLGMKHIPSVLQAWLIWRKKRKVGHEEGNTEHCYMMADVRLRISDVGSVVTRGQVDKAI
jgi:hypothetical protein